VTDVSSVFVNGRSRPAVMMNMRTRIVRGDINAERLEAIQVPVSPSPRPFLALQ
jgi:hypothetical protein